MKKHFIKLCSTILSATILASTPSLSVAYAVENSEITEKPFVMTEDENGIHFIGKSSALGSDNIEKDENVKVISSLDDYYEVTENKTSYTDKGFVRMPVRKTSASLPDSIDNSTSDYFPEIDTQGSLSSCVAWGQTYYQFTYEMNKSMTVWPEKAMSNGGTNQYNEKLYTFEVPNGATYIIFTNGSSQTVDIPYSGGEVRYYPLSATDSKGHNKVATW